MSIQKKSYFDHNKLPCLLVRGNFEKISEKSLWKYQVRTLLLDTLDDICFDLGAVTTSVGCLSWSDANSSTFAVDLVSSAKFKYFEMK